MHIKAETNTQTFTGRQNKNMFPLKNASTCKNILLMLQNNNIAAKGALHILWSTAGIKDVKKKKKTKNI